MNAIELSHVGKRYGDFALEDVNLTLAQGCILGLVGENGAGKSTMIRMILGACRPGSGTVTTLGCDTANADALADVRQDVGVVLDEACLPDELTAAQTGRFFSGIYKNWDAAAFDAYVKRFDLPPAKRVKEYSRGTKMKLAIAVAMSHDAKLLVLDEATSGLDPIVRDEILDVFNEFTRDETHAILISSHNVSDLEKICDYIAFLHRGKLLLVEEKDALLDKYAVLSLSEADYAALPADCVLRMMRAHGAVQVLAHRAMLPAALASAHTAIEDIMLLLTKGDAVR